MEYPCPPHYGQTSSQTSWLSRAEGPAPERRNVTRGYLFDVMHFYSWKEEVISNKEWLFTLSCLTACSANQFCMTMCTCTCSCHIQVRVPACRFQQSVSFLCRYWSHVKHIVTKSPCSSQEWRSVETVPWPSLCTVQWNVSWPSWVLLGLSRRSFRYLW